MPMEFINQNILLIGIVVVSALGLLWPLVFRPVGRQLSPAEATLLINREDAQVIDVREPGEFAAGHVAAAINIPMSKLVDRLPEIEKFKAKPLIICCATGMRSNQASSTLKKNGFENLANLAGGLDAWVGANYPLSKVGRKK